MELIIYWIIRSNPTSDKYGRHYTAEQIHDIFAPQPESVEAVRSWLVDSGIEAGRISQSTNKQWMQLDASVAEVEALINAEYHHYEHYQTGKTNVGCDEYSVPKEVQPHVDYITPGLKLLTPSIPRGAEERKEFEKRTFGVTEGTSSHPPVLQPPLKKPLTVAVSTLLGEALSAICGIAIIPACISTMYNITKADKAAPNNQLGIFEDLGDMYSQTDLNEFFATIFPRIPQGTHPTLKGIDGATAPDPVQSAGPESDLDFQISYPIIYPQNSILFQTDDDVYEANYTFEGFLNNFLDGIDGSYCSFSDFGETGNSPLDPPYPDPQPGGYKGSLQCGVYQVSYLQIPSAS